MTAYYYDTTNHPPPTSVAGDHAVDLSAGDSLILAAGAVIRATGSGADGINSAGGSIKLAIQGSVVASFAGGGNGIQIGGNAQIQVEATGLVSGFRSIFANGNNATVNNKGLLQGSILLGGGTNILENSGTIWGSNGDGITCFGSLTLLNRGEIFGSVQSMEQRDVITNLGSIRGNFLLLNDGDDLYDGTGGYCSSLILLGGGDDIALGGNGSERFHGGDGNDYLDGGAGIDTFEANGAASLTIDLRIKGPQNTGEGWDTLVNIENIDMRRVGGTTDRLIGSEFDNQLYGGAASDTLEGGLGNDILHGGSEEDTARYTGSAVAIVSLELQGQRQNTRGYGFDTLIEIENLSGGSGNDVFTGDNSANRLSGNAGNDVLYQKENDGNDGLDGGSGLDTVIFAGTAGATINLARTAAQTTAYGSDTYLGIENLSGGSGHDRFTGNTLANSLRGNAGHDTLEGGYGNDVLSGGADTTGRDTFVFRDRLSKTGNVDRITDYHRSYDSIQLDNKHMAKLGPAGRLSSSKFVLGTKAKDANDHLIYDRAKGYLYYDADGSGKAAQVLIAHFTNKAVLYHSEFTII